MLVDFEKLKPLLPYFSGLAIFLGITKLILFYGAFGIHIIQYIDFSEALILFFEDVLIFVLAIFIPFIIVAILFGHKMGDLFNSVVKEVVEQPNFWKRLWTFSKYNSPFIVMILIGFLTGKVEGIFILILIVTYFLLEVKFVMNKRYGTDLDPTYHNLIYWLSLVIYFGYGHLQHQIKDTRNTNIFEHSKMHTKQGEVITIDSTTLFLGRSKDYYYLYDKTKETAVIIPSDEVVRFDLKSKKRWFSEKSQ